jgi:hypothetical protein
VYIEGIVVDGVRWISAYVAGGRVLLLWGHFRSALKFRFLTQKSTTGRKRIALTALRKDEDDEHGTQARA